MMRGVIISSLIFFLCLVFESSAIDHLTVPQVIRMHGYPCEEHFVTTEDGYILALHRIPWGKNGHGRGKKKEPVIMQHGLFSSSASWTLNINHETPAYIFADEGYDVWLTNVRGGDYSRNHTHLSPSKKDFWQFSWDEMAKYDLPKFIDYVLQVTNHKQLHYVGHSMGTTIFFALMSTQVEYNSKIKNMIALAPVGTVSHIDTLFKHLCHFESKISLVLNLIGDYEIIPTRDSILLKLFNYICDSYSYGTKYCKNLLFMIVGFDDSEFDESWMPIVNDELLTGTSLNTLMHFSQEYLDGRFQHYDYGSTINYEKYGQIAPPEYDVTKITAPVHLLFGMNDYLADPTDVKFLADNLPNVRSNYAVPLKSFNHLDFLWAKDMKSLVYGPALKMMKGYRFKSSAVEEDFQP